MQSQPNPKLNYDAVINQWVKRIPWYRRTSARLGLQGKLVICFSILLVMSLGVSTWEAVRFSQQRLKSVMVDQAQQLCQTLALASQHDMSTGRTDALTRLAGAMTRSRSVVFSGFLDPDGQAVVLSSHSPRFGATQLSAIPHDTEDLMRVQTASTPEFGQYLQIVAPVLMERRAASTVAPAETTEASQSRGSGLSGYLVLGISDAPERAQMRQLYALVSGIGCVMLILTFPLVYAMVRRIFFPIRQLVAATQKITNGDLETQVAIHRPDVIGDLARCFNEMVRWVKQQRLALANANEKLGLSNRDLAKANSSLADVNRVLEAKVQTRTAELETANHLLRQEIGEKEDFLRAVSHDLNAPLRNISGMAAMLLMKHKAKFDEDIIHRIERIKTNVDLETDLISELLELSRIKTRRMKMESVELAAVVDEVAGLFEDDLRSKSIELDIKRPLPVLWCERTRLRQIFQNLVDNACKYMGDRPQKRISVGHVVKNDHVEFFVRDTGPGIAPEDVDNVFCVFRRGKSVQNIPGKGVGLASVKSIIQTYGGRIWVESTLGEGTTFFFTISGQYVQGVGSGPWPPTDLPKTQQDSTEQPIEEPALSKEPS